MLYGRDLIEKLLFIFVLVSEYFSVKLRTFGFHSKNI